MAFLIRRVRELVLATDMRCVGTSATLAGSGTYEEQRQEIARVASQLFGAKVKPEHVIGETIRRATPERDISDPDFIAQLAARGTASGSARATTDPSRPASKTSHRTGSAPSSLSILSFSFDLVIAVTLCPASTNCGTSDLPMAPVAPARKTFVATLLP